MDNVKVHDAKVVRAWLAAHPRVQVLWLPKQQGTLLYAGWPSPTTKQSWGS